MTNSESLDAESATEPTTKPESDASTMSAGAEMLIARMKTNPEDFNYNGKFYRVIEAVRAGAPYQGWISTRDTAALRAAYEANIQEPEFTEWVYGEIFNPKEPEPATAKMYTQNLAGSMMQAKNAVAGGVLQGAFTDPRGIYGSPLQNAALVGASPLQGAALTVNANAGNPTLTLGNTTISESMLSQIKNKLGL